MKDSGVAIFIVLHWVFSFYDVTLYDPHQAAYSDHLLIIT